MQFNPAVYNVSPASFRDPAGYVFRENGLYKRLLTARARADYDQMMSSGLYNHLASRSMLISHTEERPPFEDGSVYRILVPEQIRHISYPYEWSFEQLKDAALLTLQTQMAALAHGMTLKDASAFNLQFRGPRPIFIDTLSFEGDGGGPWVAYNQFCRHFLAPLLLMQRLSMSFYQLWRGTLDGISLDLASQLLPKRTYLSFGTLLHIHLHARSIKRYSDLSIPSPKPGALKTTGANPKKALAESLIALVESLQSPPPNSEWVNYYRDAAHYTSEAETFKKQFVTEVVESERPALAYDLGANMGAYSRIVTGRGIDCISYDIDLLCVDENYRRAKSEGDPHMLPLVTDLANPSPAMGFDLNERLSFFERSRPGLVLALALIHHLRITGNVPLRRLADFFAELTPCLLIEFVPKEDVMVKAMLRSREDTFFDYDYETFVKEFSARFLLERATAVPGTPRTLCVFRRKSETYL